MQLPLSPEKRCTQCGAVKAHSEFHKDRHNPDGLRSMCKECACAMRRASGRKNREKERAAHTEWTRKNVEKNRAYARTDYYKFREERNAKSREWARNHRDWMREYEQKYRDEHPEYDTARKHRRRARKLDLPDTFTGDQAVAALECWYWKCAYCDTALNQLNLFEDIEMHFDHFIPLSDPRPDNPGTVAENMLPTCSKCNCSKNGRDPIDWLTAEFGKREANRIAKRIAEYFEAVSQN